MEKTVRIVNQSQLTSRQYMDRKTGDEKGERAVNCPQYDPTRLYQVQCSMVVREWNSQQTGEAMQATTIYVDKINLM